MKKFLLLGAAAMMTMAASAQSITKVWDAPVDAAVQGARSAAGVGTKMYLPNVNTGLVEEWENGVATGRTWDINAFMAATGLTYESTNTETGETTTNNYKIWSYAKADDAGNILVNANNFGGKFCNYWVVIPADGSEMQLLNIEEMPSGAASNRVDAGFDVVGNLMEDAFVFLAPAASNNVACVNVFPADDGSGLTYMLDTSGTIPSSVACSTSMTLASTASYDDLYAKMGTAEMGNGLYVKVRTEGGMYAWDGSGIAPYLNAEGNAIGGDGCSELGFDVFAVGDVWYYILPSKDTSEGAQYGRTMSFEIRTLADGKLVVEYNVGGVNDSGNGSFYAVSNEDGKTATIYAYNQANKMGVFTFDPNGESAIESIAADANAPVEYYNLQGVKVANAENGLFIKKQGNKATKVVL